MQGIRSIRKLNEKALCYQKLKLTQMFLISLGQRLRLLCMYQYKSFLALYYCT